MRIKISFLVFSLFCCCSTFAWEDTTTKSVWDNICEYALMDLFSNRKVQQKYGDSLLYKAKITIHDYYLEVVFDKKDSIVLFSDPVNIVDKSYQKAKLRTRNKLLKFLEVTEGQGEILLQATLFQHFNYIFSVSVKEQRWVNAEYKMTIIDNDIVILGKKIEFIEQEDETCSLPQGGMSGSR